MCKLCTVSVPLLELICEWVPATAEHALVKKGARTATTPRCVWKCKRGGGALSPPLSGRRLGGPCVGPIIHMITCWPPTGLCLSLSLSRGEKRETEEFRPVKVHYCRLWRENHGLLEIKLPCFSLCGPLSLRSSFFAPPAVEKVGVRVPSRLLVTARKEERPSPSEANG